MNNISAKAAFPPGRRARRAPQALSAAVMLLRTEAAWEALLCYDAFALKVIIKRPIPGLAVKGDFPRALEEADISGATVWLQTTGNIKIQSGTTREAIIFVAKSDHSFHPVQDYLRGLAWDGTPRIDTWLIVWAGAEDNANNRAYGAKWLMGGVARIENPGCLVKTVLVLEGLQDLGKSKLLGAVAVKPAWYLDNMGDISHKDALLQTVGKWIVEFSEFHRLRMAEAARQKAFISTTNDTYRPPYGSITSDHPRQWIPAATINPDGEGYLNDETGNVRYWTVACGVGWPPEQIIDEVGFAAVVDQLWAEAYHRYKIGEKHWLDTPALRKGQAAAAEERMAIDARTLAVHNWLKDKKPTWTTVSFVMIAMGIPFEHQNRHQAAFGRILVQLGWKKWQGRFGPVGARVPYYFPPDCSDSLDYAHKVTDEEEAKLEANKTKAPKHGEGVPI